MTPTILWFNGPVALLDAKPGRPGEESELTEGKRRLTWLVALLSAGNVGAWMSAKAFFGEDLVLMGTATLAYLLGLRHAVDADHIAAIDNVTRKLLEQGDDPATVGLYFSLGHSTVVAIACGVVALISVKLQADFVAVGATGKLIGTGISAGFLFLIALANMLTLMSVWRTYSRRDGASVAMPGGPLGRLLRPLVAMITSPGQMYPLGFLFGLGFDTASEVSLLGVSVSQAGHGVRFWTIMVFPALFAAGMSLVDSLDSLLMKVVYGWALVKPRRKLLYNLAVTLFSILIALGVGLVEVLDLVAGRLGLANGFWRWISRLSAHSGVAGCTAIVAFLGVWIVSVQLYRLNSPRIERKRGGAWRSLSMGLLGMAPPKKPFLP
jgi:high-affinity nickel-transport protein